MTTPIAIEVNCATGEVVERPLSADEIAEREASAAQAEADRLARQAEEQARIAAKESAIAKLKALGLTEEEAKALLG